MSDGRTAKGFTVTLLSAFTVLFSAVILIKKSQHLSTLGPCLSNISLKKFRKNLEYMTCELCTR